MAETDPIEHIRKRLSHLRLAITATLLSNGLSILTVGTVAFMLLSLLVDFSTHMDVAQRGVVLALGIGGLGYIIYTRLVCPLLHPLSDDALATQVEARHRELSDNLLNAVQFADGETSVQKASPAMIRESIQAGVNAADEINWNDMINKRRRNLHLAAALGAITATLLFVVFLPSTMSLWFHRNILLQQDNWPRETSLRVIDADEDALVVPEGGDLPVTIVASANGVIPGEIIVQSRAPNGSAIKKRSLAPTDGNIFRTTFRNVEDPFQFRARGNDHTTRWFTITPLPRPQLSKLTLTLHPPEYSREEERILPAGQSAYYFLKGSSLAIHGQSSKSLRRVQIWRDNKHFRTLNIQGTNTFSTTIPPPNLDEGRHSLVLVDPAGVKSSRPISFVLRRKPDRKPDIQANLTGIDNMVLAKAVVPLQLNITDDYGISEAWITARIERDEGQNATHALRPAQLTSKVKKNVSEINHRERVSMQQFDVLPGNRVILRGRATDNDTISGPKKGSSPPVTLRVVTEDKLRTVLQRREETLHQQFRRMIQDQKQLLKRSRLAVSRIERQDGVSSKQKQEISNIRRSQHKMARRSKDVAGQFANMVDVIRNNRLEQSKGPMQTRLTHQVITPIDSLARDLNPRATEELNSALANTQKIAKCIGKLRSAQKLQNRIITRMHRIQENMARSETIQEAIKVLRNILREQKRLRKKTKEEQRESEESIFED